MVGNDMGGVLYWTDLGDASAACAVMLHYTCVKAYKGKVLKLDLSSRAVTGTVR